MPSFRVAVVDGDGIGPEVVPGTLNLLDQVAAHHGFTFHWTHLDWGSDRYLEHGAFMPAGGLESLTGYDAVFLGAVGDPRVPDDVSLWELLLPIRRDLRQHVNVRPVRTLPGIAGPLRDEQPFDVLVIRENAEGEYTRVGGALYENTADEIVVQSSVFTRRGTERVLRYAFEQARKRRRDVVSATKSNGLVHSMPFWDRVADTVAADYPDVRYRKMHVDALAAAFVLNPATLDVVVGSNLFGDILSDLGAALMGGIGLAASANINTVGDAPSMFEPVHGSAPDIAGKGIANPTGQILSGALMLRHLGQETAAAELEGALVRAVAGPAGHTRDVGGDATTQDLLRIVAEHLDHSTHTRVTATPPIPGHTGGSSNNRQ